MDWIIGLYILFGLLVFWLVWVFGYWLPMARESQRQYERDRIARQTRDQNPNTNNTKTSVDEKGG